MPSAPGKYAHCVIGGKIPILRPVAGGPACKMAYSLWEKARRIMKPIKEGHEVRKTGREGFSTAEPRKTLHVKQTRARLARHSLPPFGFPV